MNQTQTMQQAIARSAAHASGSFFWIYEPACPRCHNDTGPWTTPRRTANSRVIRERHCNRCNETYCASIFGALDSSIRPGNWR